MYIARIFTTLPPSFQKAWRFRAENLYDNGKKITKMIRKNKATDIEEVLNVWYAASSLAHPFMKESFMQQERKNIRNKYIPNTETWVYLEADKLVGFISMIGNEIGAVFIQPDQQDKGIGTQLVNHVAQFHESLEVEVFKENKIGKPFYDKYGFQFLKEHLHEATNQQLLRLIFTK